MRRGSGATPAQRVDAGRARKKDALGTRSSSEPNPHPDQAQPTTRLFTFHPAADIFPLMSGTEFDELVGDIKANGLKEPVVLYDGKLLDGRNRARACNAAGIPVSMEEHQEGCARIGDPFAYVVSKNFHRRHLTPEQKREALVKLVAAQATKSDRTLAREAKVDHHQIARARRKAEATGTTVPVEKRIGKDGKARKQPAKKPREDDLERRVAADATKRAERKRKDLERRAAARAVKRKRETEAFCKQHEIEEAQTKTEAERLAAGLIGADRGLARALHGFLVQCGADAIDLMDAL